MPSPSAELTPSRHGAAANQAHPVRPRPQNHALPAPEAILALNLRDSNPHRSRSAKQRHILPAVSSKGGFRTPAPAAPRAVVLGPPSETLHHSGRSRQISRRCDFSELAIWGHFDRLLSRNLKNEKTHQEAFTSKWFAEVCATFSLSPTASWRQTVDYCRLFNQIRAISQAIYTIVIIFAAFKVIRQSFDGC
jgi:hypothetical protein